MARLPDSQALGERPVPQPRGGIPSISNAGVAEGVQAQASTKGVVEFADQLAQAGERIWARDDDIKSLQAVRNFREKADAKTREFLTTGSIADPDSAKRHNEEMSRLEQEVLGGFTGRENARVKVSSQLQTLRFGYVNKVVDESTKAQQGLVLDEVKQERNAIAAESVVSNDLDGGISRLEKFIDERASLTDEVKSALKSDGRGELAEQHITNLLVQRDKNTALSLFKTWARDLDEKRRDRIVNRFEAVEKTTRLMSGAEKRMAGIPADIVAQVKSDGAISLVYNPEKDVKIRDQKIIALAQDLMKADPSMTTEQAESEATGRIDGHISVEMNPVTGKVLKIDRRTQTVTEVPIGASAEPSPVADKPMGLYESAGEGGVAGVVGFGQSIIAKTLGQISDKFVAEEIIERRKDFETIQGGLVRAFAVNTRLPAAEIQRIQKETSLSPDAFNSRTAFLAELRSIDKNLRVRLANEIATRDDPNVSPDQRSDAGKAARDIKNFLDRLDVPQNKDALPRGIPQGSKKIPGKTKHGKEIYEDPNGKRWVVE